MSKPVTFILRNESLKKDFGKITFNGKFIFTLGEDIPLTLWKEIGFIPLNDNQTSVESEDLFYYLNSRLPINLRDKANSEKLGYIKENGLRVASDSFVLVLQP